MATVELTTLPAECFPDFLVKAVQDTDSIDLEITGGVLTANLILDGATGPCANRAVIVAGQGLYVAPPDSALSIASSAFADPSNPTSAEAATAVAAASPVNPAGMIAYLIGDGTADDPDFVWYIDCDGNATNIESPQVLALAYEIGDGAFADPNYPTSAEVLTYAGTLGVDLSNGAHFYKVGGGTAQEPDYAWYVDASGAVTRLEHPNGLSVNTGYSSPLPNTSIICGGLYVFDVSGGSITQSLPSATTVPQGCQIGFKTTGNTLVGLTPTELILAGSGGETIDGSATYDQLKDDQKTVWIVSDGTNWLIKYDYDPVLFSGVLCRLEDAGLAHPNLLLLGSGIPIIEGAVVADLSWEIREDNAAGAILQTFNGAPGVPVTPAGYLVSGTYDAPQLDMTGYCGDLWVGLVATDDGGKTSQKCQLTLFDFNLVSMVFAILGDGAVTPEITINPGGIVPTWDWGDGSPVESGQSVSHTYTSGQPTYYATATVCPTDVISVNADGDRLQGSIGAIADWSRLINLQSVNLANNSLGGVLPSEWGSLPLNSIVLSNNNLSGALPASWSGIGSVLQVLYLNGNNLGGGGSGIPSSWANLDGLIIFHVADNQIEGTLDPAFSAWTSIVYFDISRNALLTGPIPASYAAWTALQYFIAEWCNLTGTLDPSLSAWPLLYFNAAGNNLTGSIPASYAAWTGITEFSVANNMLSGTLDPSFSAWTGLTNFRVAGNLLTGSIPASYAAWTNLDYFIASSNQLSGSLDTGFGAWTGLLYFDVELNLLTGAIPASYAAFGQMWYFSIASNSIDYSVAGAAAGWSSVTTVRVQGNAMTSAQIDSFIPELVAAGVPSGGTLRVDGQSPAAPLNAPACAAVTTLQGLGWTINYDAGGAC